MSRCDIAVCVVSRLPGTAACKCRTWFGQAACAVVVEPVPPWMCSPQAQIASYLPTQGLVRIAFSSREGKQAVERAFEVQFTMIVGAASPRHWSLLAQFKFLERLHKRYEADNLLYLITWATTDTGAGVTDVQSAVSACAGVTVRPRVDWPFFFVGREARPGCGV